MVRGAAQVLVVALGSVLAGLPAPAAAQNRIEVRDESTGPPLQTVRIELSDTDASSSKHVLLSRPGGKEPVEVKLQALIDGVGVTFTPADVAIPAEGRPVLVTIEVTKATAGSKTGEILAQGDLIAKLEVHKAAATPVTLVGADASTGLTLKTEVADFRHTFRVASNVAEPTRVRLTPSLFDDPTGAQVQPSLELTGAATLGPIEFDVAGGQSVPVILGLATPLSGDYSGRLELAFGSLVKVVPVKVTRSRVAPTVSFDPIPQSRIYAPLLLGDATADVDVSLRETAGRPTTIDRLVVVNVVRKETEADVATALAAKEIRKGDQVVTTPLQVAAGDTERLIVHVGGLPGPGKYEARLRLASADGTPVESTLVILVRRHWLVFLSLVFVSVAVSALLRWYFTVFRPRLLDRVRIAEASGRLDRFERELGELDEVEKEVLGRLRDHINELYVETARPRPGGVADSVELVELKLKKVLGRWADAHRRAKESGNQDILRRLAAVELYLKRPLPSSGKTPEEDTQEQIKALDGIERDLEPKATRQGVAKPPAPATIHLPDAAQLRRRLMWFELATSFVAFLIAALLGAVLLYFPNNTWGSFQDVIVAALWSLGLHQVNGKAFEGASGIKQQFGLPAGEP